MNPLSNLSSLPTDNLYKFMAISGLVIIILSLILPNFQTHDINVQIVNLQGEADLLSKEMVFLENDLKNQAIETESYNEKIKELERTRQQITSKINMVQLLLDEEIVLIRYSYIGFGLGSLICVLGFWLWYQRLQIYQDILIKHQALDLVSKNGNTTKK